MVLKLPIKPVNTEAFVRSISNAFVAFSSSPQSPSGRAGVHNSSAKRNNNVGLCHPLQKMPAPLAGLGQEEEASSSSSTTTTTQSSFLAHLFDPADLKDSFLGNPLITNLTDSWSIPDGCRSGQNCTKMQDEDISEEFEQVR